jgi:hypothetical protein
VLLSDFDYGALGVSMEPQSSALLLTSTFCIDIQQQSDQNRSRSFLASISGLLFSEVDGAENASERDKLVAISGHRGKYPQLFIVSQSIDGISIEFIGLWSAIENLIESEGELPGDSCGLVSKLRQCWSRKSPIRLRQSEV